MAQTFKLCDLKVQTSNLALKIFQWVVIVGVISWFLSFTSRLSTHSTANFGLLWLIVIIFFLVTVGPYILFVLFLNSYKVTITDDGSITETQIFRTARTINIQDISQVKWSYFGGIPTGLGGVLLSPFRNQVTSMMSKVPAIVGAASLYGWGPELANNTNQVFPRYAVTPNFVEAIRQAAPNIAVDPQVIEKSKQVQSQRTVPLLVLYIGFGLLMIFFGVVMGLSVPISWLFIITGVVFFGIAYYVSKP